MGHQVQTSPLLASITSDNKARNFALSVGSKFGAPGLHQMARDLGRVVVSAPPVQSSLLLFVEIFALIGCR